MNGRKRSGIDRKVDLPILPIREQGPETGLVSSPKYYSKTRMDKNPGRTPSDTHPTRQQKRHSARSALKNGGADVRDGFLSLKPGRCLPCLSG